MESYDQENEAKREGDKEEDNNNKEEENKKDKDIIRQLAPIKTP